MLRAVEIMRQSVPEARSDGKPPPVVGAILWRPDGTVETAHRGELREGDHAEFTLLERKNRAERLDECALFVTLEPCAPGARNPPKVCCAERIVAARIKRVWVGIEDPDPTVDRKGIKYLQDRQVDVQMFDRDLQEVIRSANRTFIEGAVERAEAAFDERAAEPMVLSPLEKAAPSSALSAFSKDSLNVFRSRANIPDADESAAFRHQLVVRGLAVADGGTLKPTGFGLLLFGKDPRAAMPHAGLLGTIHHEDGTEETRNFDGPMVLAPELALRWLRDKLPDPITRSGAQRRGSNDTLYELVREGIVNALVHRDYSVVGAKCHLVVSDETIQVRSPGRPVEPITLEQMQAFTAPTLSRSPILHHVFAQLGLAEERGLGLKSMGSKAKRAGLPRPVYSWEAPYLVLTLYRSAAAAVASLRDEIAVQLSRSERRGWEWIAQQETLTSAEYARAMDLPGRTALHHLQRLTKLGLLQKVGSGPATRYELRRP
jgi:ATP-dependent DNA helicase RecG